MSSISHPRKNNKRGRPSKKPKPNINSIRLDKYVSQLKKENCRVEKKIRKTHKGWKKLKVHTRKIWIFHGESEQIKEQTLIITQTMDGNKDTKYSFSNGDIKQYTPKEFAYFQTQRYWLERTFDDVKNELGMSDYQIRKWNGWHHHHSLVLMASLFLLKQKIACKQEVPLMSVRDARILVVVSLFGTQKDIETRINQIYLRKVELILILFFNISFILIYNMKTYLYILFFFLIHLRANSQKTKSLEGIIFSSRDSLLISILKERILALQAMKMGSSFFTSLASMCLKIFKSLVLVTNLIYYQHLFIQNHKLST